MINSVNTNLCIPKKEAQVDKDELEQPDPEMATARRIITGNIKKCKEDNNDGGAKV